MATGRAASAGVAVHAGAIATRGAGLPRAPRGPSMAAPRSRPMANLARAAVPLLLAVAPLRAQCPPGAPMPIDLALATTVAEQGAARVRWQAARDALQAGDGAAARKHVLAALEFHPASPALLLDAALAFRDDVEQAPAWLERFVRAASNANGRLELDAALRKPLAAMRGFDAASKPAGELAAARAAAIVELAKFVDKHAPAARNNGARALLVRWASELLLEAALGAPAMLAPVAGGVRRTQQSFTPDHDVVFQGLARAMQAPAPKADAAAPPTGPGADRTAVEDRRVRAARIVKGLQQQAAFRDLQGPPAPEFGKVAELAQRVLDEHAAAVGATGKVWTVAELAAMSPADAGAFTAAHRDWRDPGVATSATGRYRIETVCGHETLLGTARTIELHHERLVHHYGADPFRDRQGVVRIVPESHDLETEGAPYWWAGGFQAGDRTTVRFAWGTIPALGRTLTHELTHRFDGVLRPFLAAWYGEGHAQWTAGHYGKMAAPSFVEDFLAIRAPADTWYAGYGDRAKFERLLRGDVDDYRDNYFAGYSLYAFLRSFPPGAPRYAGALARYERNARAGQKDPVGFFAATFCDGKDGRPASLDGCFAEWQGFLRGCYQWLADEKAGNEWVARYGSRDDEGGPKVMDPPTWSWARTRAEPFFGQDHAAAATLLLREAGDDAGTVAAGVWSLAVDGWRHETATALAAALANGKAPDAAQAFAVLAQRHFPQWPAPAAPALLAALPKTAALLAALERRAGALAPAAPAAADACRVDRARLAAMFGAAAAAAAPRATATLPRHLGGHGFTESSLVGHDDRRVQGLWYTTADGDLHVGRERPRDGTGTLDRRAHQRDAFVHTAAWLAAGSYVVRGRVHLTTSYVSGAIVLGHERRDRQVRVQFTSGDFDYATGRSERSERAGRVSFAVRGMSERDDNVPGDHGRWTIEVAPDAPSFAFALHVHGPRVLVEIDGEPLLRYAMHDGAPIEGHVGFATSMGAIRVQLPTVQRTVGELTELATGLALDRQPDHALEQLLLLPTRGVPAHAQGTLVLWWPKGADGEPGDSMAALRRHLPALAKLLASPLEHPQAWVLAVPRALPADVRAAAVAAIAERRPGGMPLVEHDVGEPFAGTDPWVLFVDGTGVLRAAATAAEPRFHAQVARWARLFRERRS